MILYTFTRTDYGMIDPAAVYALCSISMVCLLITHNLICPVIHHFKQHTPVFLLTHLVYAFSIHQILLLDFACLSVFH